MVLPAYHDAENLLGNVPLPDLVLLRQHFPRPRVESEAAVEAALQNASVQGMITPGMRIAIAVGSRGVADVAVIVRALVAFLRRCGTEPFIIPAMGSHGGATPVGQEEVLASLGVTETYCRAPVHSSLEVDLLGNLEHGLPVYIDRLAHAADGIILVNRIKPHTDFKAPVESGLAKMIAIGLGNHASALTIHSWGLKGLTEYIPQAARYVAQHARLLFGLAVLENAYDEVAEIVLVPPAGIGNEPEEQLLKRASAMMPRLPWDDLDVLVVDELGKNISGAGMDTNIIGRIRLGDQKPTAARITNVVALNVTEASHGNAIGIGLADFTTARLIEQIDMQSLYINCLTAGVIAANSGKIPIILETDRAAVAAGIRSCGHANWEQVRLARIQNTLKLEYILASPAALATVRAGSNIEVLGQPRPFTSGANEQLEPFEHFLTL